MSNRSFSILPQETVEAPLEDSQPPLRERYEEVDSVGNFQG